MATKIIALDAGHGLKTSGKQTPDGIKEWKLNDKVRDYVVDYLKDYDVKFIFPDNNEGSKDESLSSRKSMYISKDVDAAVSIHHNAHLGKWGSANGVEIYVDKNNTSADMRLAEAIYKNLPEYTGLKSRGIKKANWAVINQNSVPAVLVEGGFMDNKGDYAVITSAKGQKAYAKAVAEGLIEFLNLEKKNKIIFAGAIKDEKGNLKNGKAGDQLQTSSTNDEKGEVRFRDFYIHSKGWFGFTFISDEHAKKFIEAMKQAVNNKNIGYDQNNRYDIIEKLKKYGTLEKISVPTECVCSSLVRAAIIQATGKDLGLFLTGDMPKLFEKSGLFNSKVVVDSENDVEDGMILVTKTKGHTEAVVSGSPGTRTENKKDEYVVKITAKTLNIRKSASASSKVVGVITDDEKLIKKNPDYYFKKTNYTVVGEKMNGKTKWLQLKSGIGYISANYTKKV